MKKPYANKSDEMKSFLGKMTFGAAEKGLCPICRHKIKIDEFQDHISMREYEISGMCQDCQDIFFSGA